jgi:oxalate decarboxylase/phosphoglucose isomerase-like protein (cupin superfamily)
MPIFKKVTLYTDHDGRARFGEEGISLPEGTPQAALSSVLPCGGYQLRHSPVGFRSDWHCTPRAQWVFVLAGKMEIGLRDGSSRIFEPGDHFFSADTLPVDAVFDPELHGHWSRQVGPEPLVTLFVKSA